MDSPAASKIYVELSVVQGRMTMPIRHLLKLGRGAVIELDTSVEDPVYIYANEKLVARGDVMVVEDHIGVNITDSVSVHED